MTWVDIALVLAILGTIVWIVALVLQESWGGVRIRRRLKRRGK